MPTAAFSPAAMASTTEEGPVTASPPAKIQGTEVWPVAGFDGDEVPLVELQASPRRTARRRPASGRWPRSPGRPARTKSSPALATGRAPAAPVELAQLHAAALHAGRPARSSTTSSSGAARNSNLHALPARPPRSPPRRPASPPRCGGRARSRSSAPRRSAVRAASMAALPPPMTTTFLPTLAVPREVVLAQEVDGRRSRPRRPRRGCPASRPSGRRRRGTRPRSPVSRSSLRVKSLPSRLLGLDLHAHALDHADLAGQHLARQPVGGDGLHQHAAGPRLGLEDRRLVAQPGQEVGAGQARRARRRRWRSSAWRWPRSRRTSGSWNVILLVGHEALQAADGQRLVQRRAAALVLAGVEADARADGGERVALAVQPQGLGVALLADQRDEAGHVHAGRAGVLAGRAHQRRADAGRGSACRGCAPRTRRGSGGWSRAPGWARSGPGRRARCP